MSENYFRDDSIDKFAWIQDPFKATAPSEFTPTEEENLIELSCDNALKTIFCSMVLSECWMSVKVSKMNIHSYMYVVKPGGF